MIDLNQNKYAEIYWNHLNMIEAIGKVVKAPEIKTIGAIY